MLAIWFFYEFFNNYFQNFIYYNLLLIYLIFILLHKLFKTIIFKFFKIKLLKHLYKLDIFSIFSNIINSFSKLLHQNNNFFKEGLYIDILQKLSFDLWIKNFIYLSTQVFNLNYLNNFIIKFIIHFLIYFCNNIISNEDNINLVQVLNNILIMFLLIWHSVFIIYLNIYILII